MKRVVSLVLCLVLATALCATAFAANFTDTADHWAEDAINRWAGYGIVEGIGNNEFDPEGSMTRAQAAVLFAKLLKLEAKGDITKFEDVDPDAWYAEYIALCVAAGILNGVADDAMDPNGTLTREQMMTMLCRALGIEPEATCDKEFTDSENVSDWAEGYVNALVNAGIVDGVGNNTMAPEADINRASMMALLNKGIVAYADEEGETVTVGEGTGIVLIVADNVTVKDAPAGTIVVTGAETTGAVVNGTTVNKDTVHEVESAPAGGSTGGGSVIPPVTPEEPDVDPSVPDVDPSVPDVDPSVPDVDPSVPDVDPSVPDVDPSVPDVDPSVPDVDPSVPDVDPSVPDVDPSVPDVDPSVPEI